MSVLCIYVDLHLESFEENKINKISCVFVQHRRVHKQDPAKTGSMSLCTSMCICVYVKTTAKKKKKGNEQRN